ncbi:MAG: hypothetical protein IKO49_01570 [Bacilli bacterium]|nr:hypothetical protein [Clostridia bacterium]MBR4617989.1 hypothetical protein [Bacilli bacterium]
MLKENKDITIKHLEDTILFLIRTLHKEVYHKYTNANNHIQLIPENIILYYLQHHLRFIVTLTLDSKKYTQENIKEKYFTFTIMSSIISSNNKRKEIYIPYEDTLNKLYNDIEGKILEKYIAKQLEKI